MERDRLGKIRRSIESLEEHGYEMLEHGTEKLHEAEDNKRWESFLDTVEFVDDDDLAEDLKEDALMIDDNHPDIDSEPPYPTIKNVSNGILLFDECSYDFCDVDENTEIIDKELKSELDEMVGRLEKLF